MFGINDTTQIQIGLLSVIEAGAEYGLNPAYLLSWILFIFFVARAQYAYRYGIISGFCLLCPFFVLQTILHLGVIDFVAYVPGFFMFWDILRILTAIFLAGTGFWLFASLVKRSDDREAVLKRILYAGLGKRKKTGSAALFLVIVKSLLLGIVFSFFSGTWPLNNSAIDLIYRGAFGLGESFWRGIFLFESVILLPYVIILFVMAIFFAGNKFSDKIFSATSRTLPFIFSALCAGTGLGTLLQYLKELVQVQ
ncbi:MAG: hypothetical protein AB1650_08225 [Candidatus Omnitrophota bacterium]